MTLPTHTDEWLLEGTSSTGFALHLNKSVPLEKIGESDVLVAIQAISLNYRDIAIARGTYPSPVKFPLVPTCDMAGVVLAVGSSVTSLSVDDTICVPPVPYFLSGHLTTKTHTSFGDGVLPGFLRRHIVLPAEWLLRSPDYLSPVETAASGCAAITAWNILFAQSPITNSSWVLTQGTGAVSLFAAGFAHCVGATVVATTSTAAKEQWLRDQPDLGVQHVLNYCADPHWGKTARNLTTDKEGVDLVVDVGGAGTLAQSLEAIRYDGTVAVTGFLSSTDLKKQPDPGPPIMDVLMRAANVRGILGGSRAQFEDMMRQMEEWQFHPVVDKRVFGFAEVKEALEYLEAQKHIGKVVIKVD